MFEKLKKAQEVLGLFYFRWFIEIWILIPVLPLLFISKWIRWIVVIYLFRLITSMLFPPKSTNKHYYHIKNGKKISIEKSFRGFSLCSFPQMLDWYQVGILHDIYLNIYLKEVPLKQGRRIYVEEEF